MTPEPEQRWISPQEARDAAIREFKRYGLDKYPEYASALEAARPIEPLFVRKLDDPGGGYYLVPWVREDATTLVIDVDASSGAMRQATPLQRPAPHLFLSPEDAREAARPALGAVSAGSPRLVWRPCRESMSPMEPLYEVSAEGRLVYVRMDGSVFPRLTPLGRGG